MDAGDDPYAPYYPGDEYVDWVGASIYTYGSAWPWEDNVVAPEGKFESILNQADMYQAYSVRRNKPFMITETAATFHTNTPLGPGVGELATKQSWWRQYITNPTFLRNYPQVKFICLFEFQKYEDTFSNGVEDLRDFRITWSTPIRNAFLEDFNAAKSFYLFGNGSDTNTSISRTGSIQATPTPTISGHQDTKSLSVYFWSLLGLLWVV